jgi:hypothetical protein
MTDSEILYSDKWLTLCSDRTLAIHNYTFPTASSRILQVSHIRSITTGTAWKLKWWQIKVWGILPGRIYWTYDAGRFDLQRKGQLDEIRKRSLVIDTDEGWFHSIGVTCGNISMFLGEMERMGVKVVREVESDHEHLL